MAMFIGDDPKGCIMKIASFDTPLKRFLAGNRDYQWFGIPNRCFSISFEKVCEPVITVAGYKERLVIQDKVRYQYDENRNEPG